MSHLDKSFPRMAVDVANVASRLWWHAMSVPSTISITSLQSGGNEPGVTCRRQLGKEKSDASQPAHVSVVYITEVR
eukprot:363267-Chlamydomonas_euryale.AAC.14